ncbi:thiamine phosphate synthase [Candidimonas sp. SYP-B2681]|uniref:thiamine phosphate synthase n=1 Tax=Candidimonas sp. SYP-B2681 TaxID=2497686 RepID=UPI0018F6AD5D|nr:thiamine phosphate synthase [Candidimonas sp. SYP-B2681]
MSGLRFPRGLYGVTPEWSDTDRLLDAISAAASGGMVALQWRRKTATPEEGLAQVRQVGERCKELGVLFMVNDDWRLAAMVDADGVHLGRDDGSIGDARLALGSGKIIGCSCYNQPALAAMALKADVDYVAFGAMYPSSVKPDAVQATLEDIEQGRMLVESSLVRPRPAVVAIGGITADNAGPVVHAGADSIALISGLFESDDIRGVAERCSELFY